MVELAVASLVWAWPASQFYFERLATPRLELAVDG